METFFKLRERAIVSFPSAKSFATIGHADILHVITGGPAMWGTVVSVGEQGNLLTKDGKVPGLNRILLVDSLAAVTGGFFGISSNTTYIESAAGVGEGGRTGLTAAEIEFHNWEEAIPAFLTLVTIPLTYSIARGVGIGFVTFALIKLLTGKAKELSWLVSLLFVVDMFGLWAKIFG